MLGTFEHVNKSIILARQSYTFTLLMCVVCLCAITYLIPIDWLDRFIKKGNVDLYRLTFLTCITVLFFLIKRCVTRANNLFIILCGFIAGVFSSIVAILIMSIALPDGIEKLENSMKIVSYTDAVILYVVSSLLLGGWSFGVMLSILMRFVYVGREEQQ